MSFNLYFDDQDRELQQMINHVIDHGAASDHANVLFNTELHPHGVANLATSREFRVALAITSLLSNFDTAGSPKERLLTLRTLYDEVVHSAITPFSLNTGRALIQMMKDIVRSRDCEIHQLRLINEFRKVAAGNPRIVRQFLARHHLLEMPEDWTQLTIDNHVHDSNTKGRKNPTHLMMDAWVKGIRHLTVIYYNFVDIDAARELLEAAKICGIKVRIAIEFRAVFRNRYVRLTWAPRGFSGTEDILEFFGSSAVSDFFAEGRKASEWSSQLVYRRLENWNKRQCEGFAKELGIELNSVDSAAFSEFVGKGQASRLHLSEFIHKNMLDAIRTRAANLRGELATANREEAEEIGNHLKLLDSVTPDYLLNRFFNFDNANGIARSDIPSETDDRPAIMRLGVRELLERVTSLRSGYRTTLQLSGLTAEDVLEILWDAQGLLSHIELFNVKEWQEKNLEHVQEINLLQYTINTGRVIRLKQMVTAMIERISATDDAARAEKFRYILHHLDDVFALYRNAPLSTHLGTDSTSHLGNRTGMGLAVLETLPQGAIKSIQKHQDVETIALPIKVDADVADEYRWDGAPCAPIMFVRKLFRLATLGLKRRRIWHGNYDRARITQQGSNVVTLGGISVKGSNQLAEPDNNKADAKNSEKQYFSTPVSNIFKILFGFLPAFCTFMCTQHWWFLAFFGAPLWLGITGIRNIIQMIIAAGSVRQGMRLSWGQCVNWTRLSESLMYTGWSVVLLEGFTRNFLLDQCLGLKVTDFPLLVFTIIALTNGTYISSHNIYRGFPTSAVVGNFFRSVLAIPVAVVYNAVLGIVLPPLLSMPAEAILVPAAAIISKLASDTVAGVIESTADRRNFYRLRKLDYRKKISSLFENYAAIELAFPDRNVSEMLASGTENFTKELLAKTPQTHTKSVIALLDLMYFWYYQPGSHQVMRRVAEKMTTEERKVFIEMHTMLNNIHAISQLFIDGLLGPNFHSALSFYLDKHKEYVQNMTELCRR